MSYEPEQILQANGGIKSFGWAHLEPRFEGQNGNRSEKVKLFRDVSFYGKVSFIQECPDGFIFTRHNCDQDLLSHISNTLFKITRDRVKHAVNLKPAVLTALGSKGVYVNDTHVKQNFKQILKHYDLIKLNKSFVLFQYFDDREYNAKDFPDVILDQYHLDAYIGKGGQSTVRLIHQFSTGMQFALKISSKERRDEETDFQYAKRLQHTKGEAAVMRQLNQELNHPTSHPNVIELVKVVEGLKDMFIVMEYADGGTLFDYMNSYQKERGSPTLRFLPEDEAKYCLYQVSKAVQYVHSKGIAHRDLKLENVFVKTSENGVVIKLGDFGFAKPANELCTQVGTSYFLAPEVLDNYGDYSIKVDIWTLGCLFFSCISGAFPFHPDYGEPVQHQIEEANLQFRQPLWDSVSCL